MEHHVNYEKAVAELKVLNEQYRKGEPTVSDDYYDNLRKEVQEYEALHPELQLHPESEEIGEEVVSGLKHNRKMLSLENALNEDQAAQWTDAWSELDPDMDLIGEYKYNGMAARGTYLDGVLTKVLSRGDGYTGIDITRRAMQFIRSTINTPGLVEITGEIVIPRKVYEEEFKEFYANPLAATIALVRGEAISYHEEASKLIFIPYGVYIEGIDFQYQEDELRIAQYMGFEHIEYHVAGTDIEGLQHVLTKNKDAFICDTDGVVWKINDKTLQKKLGETNHHPRYAFAYKFPPQYKPTLLEAVVFQVGFTGVVTPVAKVAPVELLGKVVTSVSLHTEAKLNELAITVGNEYNVCLSGDVIPHIGELEVRHVPDNVVKFPVACPCCATVLEKVGEEWYCLNNGCTERLVGLISRAVSREYLKVNDLGESTVRSLVELGLVKRISDIFTLTLADLLKLPSYTEYSAGKLLGNIDEARMTRLHKVIAALGIKGVSLVTASNIAAKFPDLKSLTMLTYAKDIRDLLINGIGEGLATNIANYFSQEDNVNEVINLSEVLEIYNNVVVTKPIEGIANQRFVITGTFEWNRGSIEASILRAGGIVQDKVSKKTDYLVAGEKAGNKVRLAELHKVDIITLDDLKKMLAGKEQHIPDLAIGYHVEGGETFDIAGGQELSMKTLSDQRPLFVCGDKTQWYPTHLPEAGFRTYEVKYETPKEISYNSYDKYHDLFGFDGKGYVIKPSLQKLIDEGYHMFTLLPQNDRKELPESFIIQPTKYVKSIKRID